MNTCYFVKKQTMTTYPIKRLLLAFFIIGNITFLPAQTIFVKEGATGNGTSWANATGNLKAAIEGANFGSEIWVAEGIYYPTTCSTCVFEDRQITFQLTENIKLYGGFVGNELSINDRNIEENPTILSGNIDQDDTPWGNSYSIIRSQNVTNETVIDGFIIEDGTADFSNAAAGDPFNSGAAWYNTGALSNYFAHPIARNCIFRNHFASGLGAAIYNDGAFGGTCNPTFENCRFENCTADLGGGAVYNNAVFGGDCSPTFTDCVFNNNHSPLAAGGAVSNEGAEGGISNTSFNNCHFLNNSANVNGGAVYNFGKSGICNPTFTNCQFDENSSQAGGAVYSDGSFSGQSNANFLSCTFTNNHCSDGNGGAIYNNGTESGLANPFFQDCVFHKNDSEAAGGAMFNNGSGGDSSPTFFNCVFSENLADEIGAVLYNLGTVQGNSSPSINNCLIYRNTAYVSAAGIYNLGSQEGNASPTITNCTFFGNTAPLSGAVYNNASNAQGTANAIMTNCIFWANNADLGKIFRNIWSQPTIDNCIVDVADCEELNSGNDAILNCGANLFFNQNPMFADTANNNFRLLTGSPAIDVGDNDAAAGIGVDLDGLPRLEGVVVDLGVYEFGSTAGTAPIITQNPQSQNICEGEEITFSVGANSSLPLTYQWQKNGEDLMGETSENLTISNTIPSDSGNYHCLVSNNIGEVVTTSDAVLTITETLDVMVEITASATEICAGESIILTALPSNPGLTPTYQWMLNGNVFGGSIESFSIDALQDGDEITLLFTSSADCVDNPEATSNTIVFSVGNSFEASVAIEDEGFEFCENELAIFNALPDNGGDMPAYVWFVNSIAIGNNTSELSIDNLSNGDVVQVQMTSTKECVTVSTVLSEAITVSILPIINTTVTIDAPVDTAICVGTDITFTATPNNGGSTPSYSWQKNGSVVGTDAPTYLTNNLEDGDVVLVEMTSSEKCAEPATVFSNELEVAVDSCSVATLEIFPDSEWEISPNPTSDEFLLTVNTEFENLKVIIVNLTGQIIFQTNLKNTTNGLLTKLINIRSFNNGTYFVRIENGNVFAVKKLILTQ